MNDSTITVSFYAPVKTTEGEFQRLVHVVVVQKNAASKKEFDWSVIFIPVTILFIISSVMVFVFLKLKPSPKLNSFLDKAEKVFPRFLKF